MIDHLTLASDKEVNPQETFKNLGDHCDDYRQKATAFHKRVDVFFRDGKRLLALHTFPRNRLPLPTRIETNPRHFQNYAEFKEIIGKIVSLEDCRIRRIDHAVDLAVSIEEIHRSLIVPRKQLRTTYRQKDLTGFEIGRKPEMLQVYDKARQQGLEEPLTRLELRQFRRKVPFKEARSLASYACYQPFKGLRFISTVESQTPSPIEKLRKEVLALQVGELGAQGVYKAMNKSGSFFQVFEKDLTANQEIPDLNQLYQENLRCFFDEISC